MADIVLYTNNPKVEVLATQASGSGEVNTASNVGAGAGVFKQKSGVDLQFKSLIAGTNISIVSNANDLTISGSGGISGLTTNRIPYATSATTLGDSANLTWDNTNSILNLSNGFVRLFGIAHSTWDLYLGENAGNTTVGGAGANIGIGKNALSVITTGNSNTILGANSGLGITTGSANILIGAAAGAGTPNLTTGSNNIVIGGKGITVQSGTTSDQLTIQNIIFGLGNSGTSTTVSTGRIGIGEPAPVTRLHVTSSTNAQLRLAYDGANYVTISTNSTGTIGFTPVGTDLTFNFGGLVIASSRFYAGNPSGVPTANVHMHGGTTTVPPLKFISGTNTSSVQDGAVEYDGTNYFASVSTTRYTLPKTLTGSASLDFPSTAGGANSDLTITVTGAASGDVVLLGVPNGSIMTNSCYTAWVSAANTVTVRFNNYDTITAKDPASGTFKVSVIK